MRLRDIIFGALMTLIVTIIGGVMVYYVTRESKQPSAEKLVYSVEPIVGFETVSNKVAISNIRLANLGNLAARSVRISVEFPQAIKIIDKAVSASSGDVGGVTIDKSSEDKMLASTLTLLPDESISITLLLSAVPSDPPRVVVKSDSSLGNSGPLVGAVGAKPISGLDKTITILIPIMIVAQTLLLFVILKVRRRRPRTISRNNNAFVYLHKGFVKEAEILLVREIEEKGGSGYELANRALCRAIESDLTNAKRYLEAASFFGRSPNGRAIILFNTGLIEIVEGQIEKGLDMLRAAVSISRNEILSYLEYSSIVADLSEKHNALRASKRIQTRIILMREVTIVILELLGTRKEEFLGDRRRTGSSRSASALLPQRLGGVGPV